MKGVEGSYQPTLTLRGVGCVSETGILSISVTYVEGLDDFVETASEGIEFSGNMALPPDTATLRGEVA
jgi:hypothetical protein